MGDPGVHATDVYAAEAGETEEEGRAIGKEDRREEGEERIGEVRELPHVTLHTTEIERDGDMWVVTDKGEEYGRFVSKAMADRAAYQIAHDHLVEIGIFHPDNYERLIEIGVLRPEHIEDDDEEGSASGIVSDERVSDADQAKALAPEKLDV